MEIEIRRIGEIYKYEKNARINDKTAKILAELIKKVGFNVPIVVDKEGVIIKGHARYKAAILLGMTELPVIVSENDDETNDRDRILDNRISELSKWDSTKLGYELDEIGIELSELGLGMKVGSTVGDVTLSDIEDAEEKQTKLGDRNVQAMMSFQCPECGGYFEYKIL